MIFAETFCVVCGLRATARRTKNVRLPHCGSEQCRARVHQAIDALSGKAQLNQDKELRAVVMAALEVLEPGVEAWLAVCVRGEDEDKYRGIFGQDLKTSDFKKLRRITEALRQAVDRKPTSTKPADFVERIDTFLALLEKVTPGPMEVNPDGRCHTVVTMAAVSRDEAGNPRGRGEPLYRKVARVEDAMALVHFFNEMPGLLRDMRNLIRSF